ncbi:hypothetical protein PVK06_035017 [Gossypium arboreum]|uniref:Uncharacterized protein n=1 Tax=Gossypium arboreum TaxID=29729 RepID=A0ABR0NFR3_GOSAR|nr:hypothetical protein PVK06_035017 [Gossypium arboreum]
MRCLVEVVHDVPNFNHEDLCTMVDHDEFNGEIKQESEIRDHEDDLNIVEAVSNHIDIAANVTVNVEVIDDLTITMELKLILNESVEKPIQFLAKIEDMPTKEVKEGKAQAIETSRQQISEALPPLKEVVHDVSNSDHEDLCTIINHDEFNGEIK